MIVSAVVRSVSRRSNSSATGGYLSWCVSWDVDEGTSLLIVPWWRGYGTRQSPRRDLRLYSLSEFIIYLQSQHMHVEHYFPLNFNYWRRSLLLVLSVNYTDITKKIVEHTLQTTKANTENATRQVLSNFQEQAGRQYATNSETACTAQDLIIEAIKGYRKAQGISSAAVPKAG